jgi:hypothetical protein
MDKRSLFVAAIGLLIVMYMVTAVLLEWRWRKNMKRDSEGQVANSLAALRADNSAFVQPAEGEANPEEDVALLTDAQHLEPLSFYTPPTVAERPSFYPATPVINVETSVVVALAPSDVAAPLFYRMPAKLDTHAVRPTIDLQSVRLQVPSEKTKYSCGGRTERRRTATYYDKAKVGGYRCRTNDDGRRRPATAKSAATSYTHYACTDGPDTSAAARVLTLGERRFGFGAAAHPFEVVTKHWDASCPSTAAAHYPATFGLGHQSPFLQVVYAKLKTHAFALYLPPLPLTPTAASFLVLAPDVPYVAALPTAVRMPWTPDPGDAAVRTVPLTRLYKGAYFPGGAGTFDLPFRLSTTSRFAVTYDASNAALAEALTVLTATTDRATIEFEFDNSPVRIRKELDHGMLMAGTENVLGLGFLHGLITVIDDDARTVSFVSVSTV